MTSGEGSEAVEAALDLVAEAEAEVFGAGPPVSLRVTGRIARRDGPLSDALNAEALTDPLVAEARGLQAGSVAVRPVRSELLVVGKLAAPESVKARAYLVAPDGQPRTLKVWAPSRAAVGRREQEARERVARIPEYRSLPVLAAGSLASGGHFLLEPVLYGASPLHRGVRMEAVHELVPTLARAYVADGLEDRRLSEIEGSDLAQRLEEGIATLAEAWQPHWGDRGRLERALARLVRRDRTLPCAMCHGDLVASNLMRGPDGCLRVIDWELAGEGPVAFDLAKLLLNSRDPWAVSVRHAAALRAFHGYGVRRYTWPEQLTLYLANRLSRLPRRRAVAERAGRLPQFERQLDQHLRFLRRLVWA